jgi:CubicO group peptidase (beta-lactamase class C family)
MFSVTKAMTAICVLQAVDRGLLALDAPVAEHWPEFAASGKANITLRHLLCHQAGLIGFHQPVPKDIYYQWDAMVAALAAESPWWEPGSRHGYHARTFGYLLGELLRRVSGRTVGEWFRQEIADPLGLDFSIGVPDSELGRCAQMLPARVRPGEEGERPEPMRRMMADFYDTSTPTGAAFQNPSLGPGYMNTDAFRRAQMPALNGHGTSRSVATLYANLPRLISSSLLKEATRTWSLGPDLVLKSVTRFGLGFQLHHEQAPIGVCPGSFGHAGAGGSLAFYDPECQIAFCFAMNQMQEGVVTGGTSAMKIAQALYEQIS